MDHPSPPPSVSPSGMRKTAQPVMLNQQNGGKCNWNCFDSANYISQDVEYNMRYKQAMGVAIAHLLLTLIATAAFFLRGCIWLNFAPVFHIIPIMLPMCQRKAAPIFWSYIDMSSVVLTGVSLVLGLFQGCLVEAFALAALLLLFDGIMFFILSRMDRQLISRLTFCLSQCGCCGESVNNQPMHNNQNGYQTSVNGMQMKAHSPQGQMQMNYQQPQNAGFYGTAEQSNFPPPPSVVGPDSGHTLIQSIDLRPAHMRNDDASMIGSQTGGPPPPQHGSKTGKDGLRFEGGAVFLDD